MVFGVIDWSHHAVTDSSRQNVVSLIYIYICCLLKQITKLNARFRSDRDPFKDLDKNYDDNVITVNNTFSVTLVALDVKSFTKEVHFRKNGLRVQRLSIKFKV